MSCTVNFRRTLSSALALASLVLSGVAFAAAPVAGNYKIDPVHSVAYFEIGHAGGISRFMGRFNDMAGDLVVDVPEKSHIKVEVKVDSIDTRSEALNKHIKSPDFFNAVQFPTLNFVSTAVTLSPAGDGSVSGNLTMHGVTKPVTFKLKQIGSGLGMKGEARVGYVATSTIKRSDFGMTYGIPQATTDELDLHINIEAAKQ
ncbi:YceI family protein [Rhodoferax sp. UBA5149]|uniref:YceI family protein n=1 Tax=Rhodoferax sp. UBA5149 TaxID=1947379 RepID=UPI0025E33EDF|nr:YceI family protein [Rhodoferax sp. UBA5149]